MSDYDKARTLHGCFRCGRVNDGFLLINDRAVCKTCEQHGVMSFLEALDVLNNIYNRGGLTDDDWYTENEIKEEIEDFDQYWDEASGD